MLKKFLRMPLRMKMLLPQIIVLAYYYRYVIHHRPFSQVSRGIGTIQIETPITRASQTAWDVHEAMEAVFRKMQWKDSCLIRALTAKKLLNRRGEKCTLYMGVAKSGQEAMRAHAWLRCGNLYVTGGEIRSQYTVTAIFGDA